MPKPKEVHQHVAKKIYMHRSMDDDDEDSITILPSYSNILIDDGCQVSTESIVDTTSRRQGTPFVVAPGGYKHKGARTCLPDIIDKPPEVIRGTILNKGESYWKTAVKSATILAISSFIELIIYFLVYALMGPFRVVIALLPIRETVIVWFFIMFGLDMLVLIIVKFGKFVNSKFELSKRVDMYLILIATIVLMFCFFISAAYPVYTTPYLMTKVKGTIIQNDTFCMPFRDHFIQMGTSWDAIPELRKICEQHVLCVENCRDFRTMYLWFYGTYLLTILRLFVALALWDIVSFLCMVMDLREENITYTVNLRGGYHM